jgi:putative effector of murein hydrolase LrgA (UPF0299 family)
VFPITSLPITDSLVINTLMAIGVTGFMMQKLGAITDKKIKDAQDE